MATRSSVGFAASIGGIAGASLAAHRGVRSAARRRAGRGGRPGRVGGGGPGSPEGGRDPGAVAAHRGEHRTGGARSVGSAEKLTGASPSTVGTATGGVVGALGLRPQKVAMGPVVGLRRRAGARAPARRRRPWSQAAPSSPTAACPHCSSATHRSACSPTGSAPPICRSWCPGRRGRGTSAPATSETSPRSSERDYTADAPDTGIVASLDALAGPRFDPALVDPLVREFYEHTTRFALDIVPQWRLWVRPGYLLYRNAGRAAPGTGQRPDEPAGGPARDPQPDRHDHRGRRHGVRCAAGSGRSPTTTSRSWSGSTPPTPTTAAATSASGSPCPEGSFTATLLPRSRPDRGLTLTSRVARRPGRALPHLRRHGGRRADRPGGARLRGAARRLRRRRRAARGARLLGLRLPVPDPALPDRTQAPSLIRRPLPARREPLLACRRGLNAADRRTHRVRSGCRGPEGPFLATYAAGAVGAFIVLVDQLSKRAEGSGVARPTSAPHG